MNINYVKIVNDVYNSAPNINFCQHKFTTVANAIERFVSYSLETGRHPINLKIKLTNSVERYQFGCDNFGLYFANIFTMYLDEI